MDLGNIICVTTFRQGDPMNVIENTRTAVFLDTAREILKTKLKLVTVHTETEESVQQALRQLGVVLIEQQSVGMGNVRREALSKACARFPDAQYFCWLEPEKPDLMKYVIPMARLMERDRSALGIFNRNDMASYPQEQAYYYLFCRAVATQLIGFDADYAF